MAVGSPHHITQRGNNGERVFFCDEDHRHYLRILGENAHKYGFGVIGYCLMINHVHIVGIPMNEKSLNKAVGRTNYLYARYINQSHDRSGHLWQSRFYSCPLDETHFWTSLRYVERNPVKAGMVRSALRYPWSSASAHATGNDTSGLLDMSDWQNQMRCEDWREILKEKNDPAELERLEHAISTGRPLGSPDFVAMLEGKVGRRLRALANGRPRSNKKV